jgi:transposase
MKPLSEDLRGRIVRAREEGAGVGEVCKRFAVSRSSVERYYKQYRDCGHCRPGQIGGHRKSRLAGHARQLKSWIARTPDLTLEELQALCRAKLKVRIGINALWHRLDKLDLSYKKNDARRRARQARCAGGQKSVAQAPEKAAGQEARFHR